MSDGCATGKSWRLLLLLIGGTAFTVAGASAQSNASSKRDSPVGDWRGMSICQVKPSGCHDEDSLYHFKKLFKPGTFELQADKIVDGKPITMGTTPCEYDPSDQLVCTISGSSATMAFDVRGDDMQGTMKLADGTLWRKITLKKVPKG
jgi:hypothetical protein